MQLNFLGHRHPKGIAEVPRTSFAWHYKALITRTQKKIQKNTLCSPLTVAPSSQRRTTKEGKRGKLSYNIASYRRLDAPETTERPRSKVGIMITAMTFHVVTMFHLSQNMSNATMCASTQASNANTDVLSSPEGSDTGNTPMAAQARRSNGSGKATTMTATRIMGNEARFCGAGMGESNSG